MSPANPGTSGTTPNRVISSSASSDYQLGAILGEGGMGVVHDARQISLQRVVAVKLMRSLDPDAIGKFRSEATTTGALDHPNVIPVYDFGCDQHGRLFYSMKKIRGQPWSTLVMARPLRENLDTLLRTADAIAFAHSRGFVHRDLKPENIMIGEFGEVQVVDWGLGGPIAGPHDGRLRGTPAYMPPEMLVGQTGIAGDIYQLGAILYEIICGDPPHLAENLHDLLRAVRENICPHLQRDDELMAVARRALASDPASRHPDVASFQADIRLVLDHQASIALCARAVELATSSAASADHRDYMRAEIAFEESLAAWKGNGTAAAGLQRLRHDHALVALGRGEFDLATSLARTLPVELADAIMAKVAMARIERDRATEALAQLEYERASRQQLEREHRRVVADHDAQMRSEWHLAVDEDFGPGFTSRWESVGGEWSASRGQLFAQGGQPRLLRLRRPVGGDVRIEFTCRQDDDGLNDLSCFLSALPAIAGDAHSGYEFKCGCFDNTRTALYRDGFRLHSQLHQPIRRGKDHHVIAQRRGGRLSLILDGETVFDVRDPDPIVGATRTELGLIGWVARSTYSSLRVWVLAPPRVAPISDLAFRHLTLGNYDTAHLLFQDARAAAGGAPDAGLTAAETMAGRLAALAGALPAIRERLLAWVPSARVALDHEGIAVDASDADIDDLAPLAGLPISRLAVAGNRIRSLLPLAGMPLRFLNIGRNQISDLSPLAGLPIERLRADRNTISDLRPLRALPLRMLTIGENQVSDLDPLRGVPSLILLTIDKNRLHDISPLAGLRLTLLLASGNRIVDIGSLAGMPLNILEIADNPITSIAPLADLPITHLDLGGSAITDWSPITSLRTLSGFGCRDSAVASLEFLRGLQLTTLDVRGNHVRDLSPLAEMKEMVSLKCSRNGISDVGPLSGLSSLRYLVADDNAIGDARPLATLGLKYLCLTGNPLQPGGVPESLIPVLDVGEART